MDEHSEKQAAAAKSATVKARGLHRKRFRRARERQRRAESRLRFWGSAGIYFLVIALGTLFITKAGRF